MVWLTTRPPKPTLGPLKPFKNKVFKLRNKTPKRGACREGCSRLKTTPLAQDPGKRSLPGRPKNSISEDMPWRTARPGKAQRAASFRARQGSDRGKVLASASFHCVPALQLTWPRVALGPFLGHVADGCAAWGYTVASHDDEASVVANGDARTDAFYTVWGDGDGHSMPLSPTVKVR